MLNHETVSRLKELRLFGMVSALESQRQQTEAQALPFEDRLGLLIDTEITLRETKKCARLLARAKLKGPSACIENIDYDPKRGLDRPLLLTLANCHWVEVGQNLIITGATGSGKSWLACAYGNRLCRSGVSVRYFRVSRLLEQITIAQGDGSLPRLRAQLSKVSVLILDDWLLSPISAASAREFLELIDDRIGKSSIILTSQYPVDSWHDRIKEPTVADAILDRIIHVSHRIVITGGSMRKRKGLGN
ncbi:MAG: ATP-binding protein [Methyloglobulus sp.]|nr:ATP-binding protein [Methyloglobulus sp.]